MKNHGPGCWFVPQLLRHGSDQTWLTTGELTSNMKLAIATVRAVWTQRLCLSCLLA